MEIQEARIDLSFDITNTDLGYEYPDNLKLRPGSELHDRLVSMVMERATDSFGMMSKRFSSWNEIDKTLTCYMWHDEEEEEVLQKDPRKPVSIVIPYTYATLETTLTYLMAAFLQDPIFRYEGVSGEDVVGATLLELVIAQQCRRNKIALSLHSIFRDCLAYGIGVGVASWEQVYGTRERRVEPLLDVFSELEESARLRKVVERKLLWEGNSLSVVDPYRFLPDPSQGIQDIQKGTYCGWLEGTSYVDLLSRERHGDDLFNVKYLKYLSDGRSSLFGDQSGRYLDTGGDPRDQVNQDYSRPVDVIHMFIKIIPNELDLPGGPGNEDGEYPEHWYFAVGGDSILISARPLDLNHGKFPVVACAPGFDGRSVAPISRLELVHGIQTAINFVINSHITNIRKALNDMFVADPLMVNIRDLSDPRPGRIIRLRRAAWGRGVKDYIQQLKVTDVTANNVRDAIFLMDIVDRVSAATHNLMGVMRPGSERRSAQEFQGTHAGAISRMERIARIISLQALQDLAYIFASHTQQFMSEETFVKVAGEYAEKLKSLLTGAQEGRLAVSPDHLDVSYDVIVRDGSVPGTGFSDAWVEIFRIITSNELLSQAFDVPKIFEYIAKNLGAKNVEEFKARPIKPQLMDDEEVLKNIEAGNLRGVG